VAESSARFSVVDCECCAHSYAALSVHDHDNRPCLPQPVDRPEYIVADQIASVPVYRIGKMGERLTHQTSRMAAGLYRPFGAVRTNNPTAISRDAITVKCLEPSPSKFYVSFVL
jgi:hypothetical protein